VKMLETPTVTTALAAAHYTYWNLDEFIEGGWISSLAACAFEYDSSKFFGTEDLQYSFATALAPGRGGFIVA
jgi:hypothetical protein